MTTPALPPGVRTVAEEPGGSAIPALVHPEWRDEHPWLIQGTTTRGACEAFDLALFSSASGGSVHGRWSRLLEGTGCVSGAHARQLHGTCVRVHRDLPPGLHLAPPCDGHATRTPGLLLAVTVADCVPITLVDPGRRVVAAVHGGWRGVAAGILDAAVVALRRAFDVRPEELQLHLGPAICGACYEVGPEVHRALGLPEPDANTPVDVRAVLAREAVRAGVAPASLTVSSWCTRCGPGGCGGETAAEARPFFSHRAGEPERQVGFVGVRAT